MKSIKMKRIYIQIESKFLRKKMQILNEKQPDYKVKLKIDTIMMKKKKELKNI